jgi:hypothetical protein
MGLFGISLGTPTLEQFADLFVKEMRRSGDGGEYTFNPENHSLNGFGEESLQRINLKNFFNDYCSLPRGKRKAWLRHTCRWLSRSGRELPGFDQVKERIMPALRSRFAGELLRLQFEPQGKSWSHPCRWISEYLIASVMLDEGRGLRGLEQNDLDGWGITFEEAMEVAIENLDRTPPSHFSRLEPTVYVCQTYDAYDATRMLSARFAELFPVEGQCIAMPLARDTLLVTSAESEAGLRLMADLAVNFSGGPRPIGPIPHALVDGQWRPWMPPEQHPVWAEFDELAVNYRGGVYAEQTPILQAWLDAKGIEAFAAQFSGVRDQATGVVRTFTVLTMGCPTWLPQADDIVFLDPQTDRAKRVTWEDATAALGDALVPQDIWPPRWSIDSFPAADILERMPGETVETEYSADDDDR